MLGHDIPVNQHLLVLLLRAALSSLSTQPVFVLGVALTHVQDLAFGLVELPKDCMGPPLSEWHPFSPVCRPHHTTWCRWQAS